MKARRRAPRRFVLEKPRRLSRSMLWDLQRRFFDSEGVRAWSEAVVPQYVTSNPWIAESYAMVVFGWLRDGRRAGTIDRKKPVDIIELGCGSGRFGYRFLRRLLELLEGSPLRGMRIRYVLTDFTDYNLDILRSHLSLQPFVNAGLLDFARFDAESDRELHLTHSGDVLSAKAAANPIAVIANYVFDGIRNDCFRLSRGKLQERLVQLESAKKNPGIAQLTLAWKQRTITGRPYKEPSWNRILAAYRRDLGDTTFLFPTGALIAISNLLDLSRGRSLLLASDKGHLRPESLRGLDAPHMAVHGSFSFMVNFHAIGEWMAGNGGEMLRSSHGETVLHTVAGLFGEGDWTETRLAYESAIERRGPDDFFALRKGIDENYGQFTLEQLIALLRFSGHDEATFLRCFPTLMGKLEGATSSARLQLRTVLNKIWENYFPLREWPDLPFHLGFVLMAIGATADALQMFERSRAIYGPDPDTSLNAALCHSTLEQWSEARRLAEEALELNPELAAARELLDQVLATMRS